jgi:hypothetical protein
MPQCAASGTVNDESIDEAATGISGEEAADGPADRARGGATAPAEHHGRQFLWRSLERAPERRHGAG